MAVRVCLTRRGGRVRRPRAWQQRLTAVGMVALTGCGGAMHRVPLDPAPHFGRWQRVLVWQAGRADTLRHAAFVSDSVTGHLSDGQRLTVPSDRIDSLTTKGGNEWQWWGLAVPPALFVLGFALSAGND